MRKFQDFLKFLWAPGDVDHKPQEKYGNKFVWGPKDVEHHKTEKVDHSNKFVWGPKDVEHHKNIKEEKALEEKFKLSPEHPGNYDAPKHIDTPYHFSNHPYNQPSDKRHIGTPEYDSPSHDAFTAHNDSLSDEEQEAIRNYKGSDHREINDHLRYAKENFDRRKKEYHKDLAKSQIKFVGDKPKEKPDWENYHTPDNDYQDYLDNKIHHLDNATNHRTVEPHTVFRGGHPGDIHRFPIGHEFTDHGYSSTSFNMHTARGFAKTKNVNAHKPEGDTYGNRKFKDIVHVIHAPEGTRGHYLDIDPNRHSNSSEAEFLLHRGTKFKVTHHSEDSNTHYIHSRIIKQGVRQHMKMEPPRQNAHTIPNQHKFPFMKNT
jgi:ADP-ribosyltransferase exoenzyme